MKPSIFLLLSLLALPALAEPAEETLEEWEANRDADEREAQLPELPMGWNKDAHGCLVVKDYGKEATNPWNRAPKIPLTGKLAVTYVDQSKNPKNGTNHEAGLFHFASGVTPLTNDKRNDAEVELSPDGKKFLYTVRPKLDDFDSNAGIYLMDLEKPRCERNCKPGEQNPKLLVGGRPVGVPAWHHPRGDKFTYIQWGKKGVSNSKFFTFDMATMTSAPFATNIQGAADPEVSYDGKMLTFKMAADGDRDYQPSIYVSDIHGNNLKRLTGLEKDEQFSDHDPVFSKDGKKIYFERYYGPGDWFEASQKRGERKEYNWWGIVEVDVDTLHEKVIVPPDWCGLHFFWLPTVSPDGDKLMYAHVDVWAAKPNAWSDLWVSDIDGGRPQLVPKSEWLYFFDWSH